MQIKGIITAMVTPYHNGIDIIATHKLIDRLINKGVNGLFVLGTNGEFFSLSYEEKIEFVREVVNYTNGRVPIYAGAGGISTAEVIRLVNDFEKLKVNAVSIITPYLMRFSDTELENHYLKIVENTQLPIILYNIPANTGINISHELFTKLIKHKRIIGIKDSSGDLENLKGYIDRVDRNDFSVLVGSDSKILQALQLGASGAVAGTSNILTTTDIEIYNAYCKGDIVNAQKFQESINDLRGVLKFGTVPSVIKYCLFRIGIGNGDPILPVLPLSTQYYLSVDEVLYKFSEIEQFNLK